MPRLGETGFTWWWKQPCTAAHSERMRAGGEKGSMHAMSSPFVSSKLPAQATRYQVPSTLLNPKQQPLVERQSDAAASPEALASSGTLASLDFMLSTT